MLLTNKSRLPNPIAEYYLDWILGRFNRKKNFSVFYGSSTDFSAASNQAEYNLVILTDFNFNNETLIGSIDLIYGRILNFDIIDYVYKFLNDKDTLNTSSSVDAHGRLKPKPLDYSLPILDDLILRTLSNHKDLTLKKLAATYSLSHDIDNLYAFNSPKMFARSVKRIITKGSLKNRFLHLGKLFTNYIRSSDPYYNLIDIAKHSEALGTKSRFYFMAGGTTKYDGRYAIRSAIEIVNYLKDRGHIVGIHPSYATYYDMDQLLKEIETFEKFFGFEPKHVRHHYLRFSDQSLATLDALNIEHDFSSGFGCTPGYRNGTTLPFRKMSPSGNLHNMISHPLTIMDTTLLGYKQMSYQEIINYVNKQIDITVRFGGNLELLWHNSNMFFYNDIDEWQLYREVTAILNKHLKPLVL